MGEPPSSSRTESRCALRNSTSLTHIRTEAPTNLRHLPTAEQAHGELPAFLCVGRDQCPLVHPAPYRVCRHTDLLSELRHCEHASRDRGPDAVTSLAGRHFRSSLVDSPFACARYPRPNAYHLHLAHRVVILSQAGSHFHLRHRGTHAMTYRNPHLAHSTK